MITVVTGKMLCWLLRLKWLRQVYISWVYIPRLFRYTDCTDPILKAQDKYWLGMVKAYRE